MNNYPKTLGVDESTAIRAARLHYEIACMLSLAFSQPYGGSGAITTVGHSTLFKDVPFATIREKLDELEQIYKDAGNDNTNETQD